MDPGWKKIRLALERPYKDDDGDYIPVLKDITAEGQHVYEQKENPSRASGEKLRRILVERSADFFERNGKPTQVESALNEEDNDSVADLPDFLKGEDDGNGPAPKFMTTEELFKMRMEILPQLFISLGEMSHARDLLSSMLLSPQTNTTQAPSNLSATVVSKPPQITSVQAFNSQLTIGSKDEALRKASDVFRSAAQSMERGRIKGERYWVDALKIRRGNWGLIPAPLPYGAATGKGADKTSKDFLISYGLEESLPIFRRQAVGRLATYDDDTDGLIFSNRQYSRLCISITHIDDAGKPSISSNRFNTTDSTTLDGALKAAQQEVVEQEIFSLLVKEAGSLPTASARVSERLIVIDAAQSMELKFELLDVESFPSQTFDTARCDLIYSGLHALLLRRHGYLKRQRLGETGIIRPNEMTHIPPILQPIIDLIQYQVFCQRIKTEIDKMVRALSAAGIPSTLRFDPVGEIGLQLLKFFDHKGYKAIGGEAVLRIDDRHTIRLTFLSPSSLIAHLSQATLAISSIPQLCQLLNDEIERCLLQRICELGIELCDHVGGIWFVDLSRCVGRWEGCVLNFRISYGSEPDINCSAFRLDKTTHKQGHLDVYNPTHDKSTPLLSWVENIIKSASS